MGRFVIFHLYLFYLGKSCFNSHDKDKLTWNEHKIGALSKQNHALKKSFRKYVNLNPTC